MGGKGARESMIVKPQRGRTGDSLGIRGGARAAAVDVGSDVMDLLAVFVRHRLTVGRPRVRSQHHPVLEDDPRDGRPRLHRVLERQPAVVQHLVAVHVVEVETAALLPVDVVHGRHLCPDPLTLTQRLPPRSIKNIYTKKALRLPSLKQHRGRKEGSGGRLLHAAMFSFAVSLLSRARFSRRTLLPSISTLGLRRVVLRVAGCHDVRSLSFTHETQAQ